MSPLPSLYLPLAALRSFLNHDARDSFAAMAASTFKHEPTNQPSVHNKVSFSCGSKRQVVSTVKWAGGEPVQGFHNPERSLNKFGRRVFFPQDMNFFGVKIHHSKYFFSFHPSPRPPSLSPNSFLHCPWAALTKHGCTE